MILFLTKRYRLLQYAHEFTAESCRLQRRKDGVNESKCMHFIRLLKKQYFDMKLRYKRGKRNMWKKVYLTILSIITVGAIIIGSMIHFGGFRFGSWEFSGNETPTLTFLRKLLNLFSRTLA